MFFSLLSALIVLGLYILFLKNGMVKNWQNIPDNKKLLDPWLMGGMLSVTATTTTLTGAAQLVKDKEHQRIDDFLITPVSSFLIHLGYFFSAVLIGLIMQSVVLCVTWIYFASSDNVTLNLGILPQLLGMLLLNSLCASSLNLLIVVFTKRVTTLGTISSIVGTASGFFAGVYIPIGSLPHMAQTLIKLYPGTYSASLYRRILMHDQLISSFRNLPAKELSSFKKMLGIGLEWRGITTASQEITLILAVTLLALLLVCVKVTKLRK
ncbi:ABC-type multidrug transport system, permease component [Liquorilactobacillus sucicola DSM 21376 = JCM 15457]|uniref:ABC-type multidrug transport system, permease component n=2 Tax=Liquorilactobacillus sucicola TaxID=519050 RepID=A0A0R2DYB6_9LACO|nr:ABC-type multidrug transport system, permease component [Liquorilactobacillus sucicola DSM 21376 = JCM 15457]